MIRPRVVVLVAFALGASSSGVAARIAFGSQPGEALIAAAADPAAIMRHLSEDLDLQTKLPGEKREADATPSDANLKIPGAQTILWIALAVALVLVLVALKDSLPGVSRRLKTEAEVAAERAQSDAAAERMVQTGDEADEMAALGRVGEAMHLLLLRSLAELRRRLGITFADSLTSREILARLTLPEAGREALADMIRRVEFGHFGAKPSTAEDYAACRDSYERLIAAMLDRPAPGPTPDLRRPLASAA